MTTCYDCIVSHIHVSHIYSEVGPLFIKVIASASIAFLTIPLLLKMNLLVLSTILMLALSTSALNVRYVKPNSSHPCPGQPCLTWDQYTLNITYFTTGATFHFLTGNHTVLNSLKLSDTANITITGNATVTLSNGGYIECVRVADLKVQGLTFVPPTEKSEGKQGKPNFNLTDCHDTVLSELAFLGSGVNNHVLAIRGSDVLIINSTFDKNLEGGVILALQGSNISLIANEFSRNSIKKGVKPTTGGAVHIKKSKLTLTGNIFADNTARQGGAIYAYRSKVAMTGPNVFVNNSATSGGAVSLDKYSTLLITDRDREMTPGIFNSYQYLSLQAGTIWFVNNTARSNGYGGGGAISVASESKLLVLLNRTSMTFENNMATEAGGAIFASQATIIIIASDLNFNGNRASCGGAIWMKSADVNISTQAGQNITFIANTANTKLGNGGAIYVENSNLTLANCTFSQNRAEYGGAIYSEGTHWIIIKGTMQFMHNSAKYGGAWAGLVGGKWIIEDDAPDEPSHWPLVHKETIVFTNNSANGGGGAIHFSGVYAVFNANMHFERNKAPHGSGGAIMIDYLGGTLQVHGQSTSFVNNTGHRGGAVYLLAGEVFFKNNVIFHNNTAYEGGAMYFSPLSTMILEPMATINTSKNFAQSKGGVMYHKDDPTINQCMLHETTFDDHLRLPSCFWKANPLAKIISINDTAGENGGFLYGGLVNKCGDIYTAIPYEYVFQVKSSSVPAISSDPYYLCFCNYGTNESHYFVRETSFNLVRGQQFNISLIAFAQPGNTVRNASLFMKVGSLARLDLAQSKQTLYPQCTNVSYNLYSLRDQETLTPYVDGPCHDTGTAALRINVTFLPCPDGFILDKDRCICDERLQAYDADCIVGEPSYTVRKAGSSFWMSALYNRSNKAQNQSYQGLILYKTCPEDYCTSDSVNITLDNLDVQCDLNRSGVLCGACATDYSLMLGSSKCQVCSNTYLTLLFPFAAAGVALVVFLTSLRLTVATGMINGLILYANIVQANKHLFLPEAGHTSGFLSVFIAWLNLDLGIQTCFYDGMDAYSQTWLQFAFPLYVWTLMGLIVLTSRHSLTVSRLIGSNPIAVLATLLLMSYAKVLKIVIAVYSFAKLDYPDNKTVTVWLKDANVPHLQSRHLLLTVVTSLALVCLFLPYTLLLLLAHKLYHYSDKKCFLWLNRLKPLLDSYYAPYKFHTRYWTGLMLLVRCALYIQFSVGNSKLTSLVAIIITSSTAAGYLLSGRIYDSFFTNVLEASLFVNLVMLSAATGIGTNSPALVETLVVIAFVSMMGIFVYHFHISYITTSALWLRLRAKLCRLKEHLGLAAEEGVQTPLLANVVRDNSSPKVVTRTWVSVREPLLEF